jgi:thiosulfate dehydrogenase (quinone) large subunit
MKTLERTRDGVPVIEMMHEEPVRTRGLQRVFGILRIAMGWTFLWAFLDKAFGLGFSTGRDVETGAIVFGGPDAWVNGGSPTAGVVGFALKGPFKGTIQSITGYQMTQVGPHVAAWVDWLYMVTLLAIGVALILGIATKLAAIGGIAWLATFYLATAIWPEHNPFLDEHIVEIVVLVGVLLANAGRYYGLGKVWQKLGFVKERPYLY